MPHSFNASGTEDFFEELYANRPSKIAILMASCLLTVVNVFLLYGIIWFERYGADLKRTLVDKSIASLCWCELVAETIWFGLNFLRYVMGPLPPSVCWIKTGFVYTNGMVQLLFVDVYLITRYLYIFVLKNPASVEDDFW